MSPIRTRYRGHKRLKPLTDFAVREGWAVDRTAGGHLKLVKPGVPPIFTGAMAGDHRATNEAGADD